MLLAPLELVSGVGPPLELVAHCPPLELLVALGPLLHLVVVAICFRLVALSFSSLPSCDLICCLTFPLVQLCSWLDNVFMSLSERERVGLVMFLCVNGMLDGIT